MGAPGELNCWGTGGGSGRRNPILAVGRAYSGAQIWPQVPPGGAWICRYNCDERGWRYTCPALFSMRRQSSTIAVGTEIITAFSPAASTGAAAITPGGGHHPLPGRTSRGHCLGAAGSWPASLAGGASLHGRYPAAEPGSSAAGLPIL